MQLIAELEDREIVELAEKAGATSTWRTYGPDCTVHTLHITPNQLRKLLKIQASSLVSDPEAYFRASKRLVATDLSRRFDAPQGRFKPECGG